jgi:chromosome partitioning protein
MRSRFNVQQYSSLNHNKVLLMVSLSAFNKGGVGKTTLAVHVAGLLAAEKWRVLLIDCVDQYDSFYFFCRQEPKPGSKNASLPQRAKDNEQLTLIWNPGKNPLRDIININHYDYIILDINSPNEDTVKTIVENHPDIILLPINDQALALDRLEDTLSIVAAIEQKAGYQSRVRIVPFGATKTEIKNRLSQIMTQPRNLEMTKRVNKHPKEFSEALREGKFVWNYTGCDYILEILQSAVSI